MYQINIEKLKLNTVIGVYNHERDLKQEIFLTAIIDLRHDKACTSDAISDTFDYADFCEKCHKIAEQSQFFLLERLLEEICSSAFESAIVKSVSLTLEKPSAAKESGASVISVSLHRTRE